MLIVFDLVQNCTHCVIAFFSFYCVSNRNQWFFVSNVEESRLQTVLYFINKRHSFWSYAVLITSNKPLMSLQKHMPFSSLKKGKIAWFLFLFAVTYVLGSRCFHSFNRDASNSAFCFDQFKSPFKSLSSLCESKCFSSITKSLSLLASDEDEVPMALFAFCILHFAFLHFLLWTNWQWISVRTWNWLRHWWYVRASFFAFIPTTFIEQKQQSSTWFFCSPHSVGTENEKY